MLDFHKQKDLQKYASYFWHVVFSTCQGNMDYFYTNRHKQANQDGSLASSHEHSWALRKRKKQRRIIASELGFLDGSYCHDSEVHLHQFGPLMNDRGSDG